jgi:type II secretory ATPase GspE/PulE/Tfp pilus assembly ATPase PilB-like protein
MSSGDHRIRRVRMTAEDSMPRHRAGKLGEILVATSLITQEQLDKAIAAQARTGKRLGRILIEQGAATEDDVAWALSNQLMYPYVFLSRDSIDDEVVRLLPETLLRERHILPIHRFGQQVTVAMADPTDQRTVDEVATQTGLQVNRAVALESNIEDMLRQLPSQRSKRRPRPGGAEAQYLQFHLANALQEGATEIHFDPAVNGQHRVRYRLQGVLVDRAGHPKELHDGLVRHLSEFAGLEEATSGAAAPSTATPSTGTPGSGHTSTLTPGTGSTTVTVGEIEAHAVVSIVPAVLGPAAVVSLYPYRDGSPDLTPLGVEPKLIEAFRRVLEKARGAVMIGCADPLTRATLLQAMLPEDPRRKIWTIETLPVYRNPWITQTVVECSRQASSLLGGAFGTGADIVAIDDASHASTLVAALEWARTRTLVLGHPQGDLVGLVAEVIDAVGGALVTSTLAGVLAARRIRLLCPGCKERLRGGTGSATVRYTFAPRGCAACGFTGFRGSRVLTAAWLAGKDDRGRWRGRGATREAGLARLGRAVGPTMRAQGHALVDDGLTSLEELSRVLEEA